MIFQLPETYRNYLKGNIAKGTISCLHFSMTFGSIFQRWRHKFSGLDFKYLFVYQQNYVDYKNKSNNYQKVLIPITRPAFCSARRVLPRQLPVAVAGTTRWASRWQFAAYPAAWTPRHWGKPGLGHPANAAGMASTGLGWRALRYATFSGVAGSWSCRFGSLAGQSTWRSPLGCCSCSSSTRARRSLKQHGIFKVYSDTREHPYTLCIRTVLSHQNWRAVAPGLHIDHNPGILFGEVQQVVLNEVAIEHFVLLILLYM